jgi:hypothetical protein
LHDYDRQQMALYVCQQLAPHCHDLENKHFMFWINKDYHLFHTTLVQ